MAAPFPSASSSDVEGLKEPWTLALQASPGLFSDSQPPIHRGGVGVQGGGTHLLLLPSSLLLNVQVPP